jgi:hypothetical protein
MSDAHFAVAAAVAFEVVPDTGATVAGKLAMIVEKL